jgi:hypothetical protein
MNSTATMPMPGALRMRALHPLIDGDGSCSLIYDLERAAVLEVPVELQFHVASALETGEPDDDLLSWLVREDLITSEGWAGGRPEMEQMGALQATSWGEPGTIYRQDDEVHARIDQLTEEAAAQAIEIVFKQGFGAARVCLHAGWDGAFPGFAVLGRIVVVGGRQAKLMRQEVSYELTLDASEVTPAVAAFLADYPFQVVLRCGSFPQLPAASAPSEMAEGWEAEPAVQLLLSHLGERVTVHCVLSEGARLFHLWSWAKRSGVRRLDVLYLEGADGALTGARDFRLDLVAVCDEMGSELEAQRLPIDYRPLTRIVRRLMRSEPLARLQDDEFAGFSPVADIYPPRPDSMDSRLMPGVWLGLDEPDSESDFGMSLDASDDLEADGFPCQGCWARYICSHSTVGVTAAAEGEDGREPSEDRCSVWRAEAESALRLYHRMAHADPLLVVRFFEEPSRVPDDPLSRRENLGSEPTF